TDFGWRWLLRAMPASYGFELNLFLVAATFWSIVRPKTGTYALLAFVAICLYSLLGGHPQLEFRYLINPLIAMAIIAGATVADLMSWVRSRIGPHADYAIAVALVLLLVPSAVRDVETNRILSRTDTRTLARIWIVNHIPAGATIVVVNGSSYGRPNLDGRYNLVWVDSALRLRVALNSAKWVLSNDCPPLYLWSPGLDDDELEVLNSTSQLQFEVASLKSGYPTPEFDPYDAFYVPFTNITGMSRPGPRIRIWHVTSPPEPFFGGRTDGNTLRFREDYLEALPAT
ncbi:MAG TPA: hypothetical protein VKV03_02425, partial [Candidatus Binataceae bacterium]|nr:hypothetical protein [Candidatus Binataceae bacterium]